jgi:hypothetical protein
MSNIARIIDDADYNSIRKRIIAVMGNGNSDPDRDIADSTFGYGQTLISSNVSQGDIITKEHWDALRFDILNARIHQDGSIPSIVESVRGQAIRFGSGSPNNQYNLQTTTAITNRLNLGAGQFVVESASDGAGNSLSPITRTTSWNGQLTCTVNVNFNNEDHARFFFNSGGRIRFSSSRAGGADTLQNSNWTSLLNSIGSIDFAAVSTSSGGPNFYNLTSSYQVLVSNSGSQAYAGNNYLIQVRQATSTQIQFVVQWTDNYIDLSPATPPFDVVDGTLTLSVDEIRASGTLLPLAADAVRLGIPTPGNFTIERPSFVISSISGS